MNMVTRRWQSLGIFCVMTASLALSACTNGSGAIVTNGAGPNLADVQANFALPLYPGATIDASNKLKNSSKKMATIVLETDDETDKVSKYYQEQLQKKGWKLAGVMAVDRMSTIEAQKSLESACVVIASAPGGKTTISLSTTM